VQPFVQDSSSFHNKHTTHSSGISTKLATNIYHESRHWWDGVERQRLKVMVTPFKGRGHCSWPDKLTCNGEGLLMMWYWGSPVLDCWLENYLLLLWTTDNSGKVQWMLFFLCWAWSLEQPVPCNSGNNRL